MMNVFSMFLLVCLTALSGVVMFAYYATEGCDPFTSKQVANVNQLIPLFVVEVLHYPGLPGLFVACLVSASLR